MNKWFNEAVFYHIYPLGFCGAPAQNDFQSEPISRIRKIGEWIPHIRELGANVLYLGPVFEASTHGYDTRDYRMMDRRLGTNDDLKTLSGELHAAGIKLVLDGVFNHVGRDFPAFTNILEKGAASSYASWFPGIDFNRKSPYGDPFAYEGWNGHFSLAKLNLKNPDVKNFLFEAIRFWISEFNIDGLRLDAADCLDFDFLKELSAFCKGIKQDFWLMGEVIHGNYRKWTDAGLDSVTNYEAFKGLWSSHNDANYFEIAYTLKRQFGENGIYSGLSLYNFADNHDVNRTASLLKNPAHLYPLSILLFTIPGSPSVYYGSEWGISGKKAGDSDAPLRPELFLKSLKQDSPQPALIETIRNLIDIRKSQPSLRYGNYHELLIKPKQFAFSRETEIDWVIVAVNSDNHPVALNIPLSRKNGVFYDALNPGKRFPVREGVAALSIDPNWGRILIFEKDR